MTNGADIKERTAGPWKLFEKNGVICVLPADGFDDRGRSSLAERRANAAEIVRCCNGFPKLLDFVKFLADPSTYKSQDAGAIPVTLSDIARVVLSEVDPTAATRDSTA